MELHNLNYTSITIWIDAQLSPIIAHWLQKDFGVKAHSVKALGLQKAADNIIYEKAKAANVILITKDKDLVQLQKQLEPPPKIIYLTCGNTTNAELRRIMHINFKWIMEILIDNDESLIEITE